jgi:hypothetical protein
MNPPPSLQAFVPTIDTIVHGTTNHQCHADWRRC